MLPWQPRCIFLHVHVHVGAFKANIYAISFIVWLVMLYLIFQSLGLSFGCCITALGFISGCYAARTVLNFGKYIR